MSREHHVASMNTRVVVRVVPTSVRRLIRNELCRLRCASRP